MTWNHRVVRRKNSDEEWYAIHEAYYNKRSNKVHSITAEPVAPAGETMEELLECIERMKRACELPVLDYDKIPER